MQFSAGNIYHIYNRGNNKQLIFFRERNYIYFLDKMRQYIAPRCDIMAYVLMPNHFHMLIHATEDTQKDTTHVPIVRSSLSEGIRLLLSSYTKGINKQENRTGNLIQQTTKSKCVHDIETGKLRYARICLQYIHDNPVKSGLVSAIENWHYSSFRDYAGLRNGTLCNRKLTSELLGLPEIELVQNTPLDTESLKNIW